MPSILIARFLLELRHMNMHPNGTTRSSVPLTDLHIASHHIQSTIVGDFGYTLNPYTDALGLGGSQSGGDEEVSHAIDSERTSNGFEIREAAPVHSQGVSKA
jgi:hypothetical protein